MKHMRTKMMLFICLLVIIPLVALGMISINLNQQSTIDTLNQTMSQLALMASGNVGNQLNSLKVIALETGKISRLSDPNASDEARQGVIDEKVTSYAFSRGTVADLDGYGIARGRDHSSNEYFQAALKGEAYITEPYVDAETDELVIILSAPLWANGVPNTTVAGVIVYEIPGQMLIDMVAEIKVSPSAGAQIIDKNGTIIAHPDEARVLRGDNSIEIAKTDETRVPIAELEKLQTQGKSGFGTYQMDGISKFLAFAPIAGTNGWSLGVNAPESEFMEVSAQSLRITIIMLIGCLILSLVISFFIARSFSLPVSKCADRLQLLAEGDLNAAVPTSKSKDEIGVLVRSLDTCITELRTMVGDVSYHLSEMADGNLATEVTQEYQGDFKGMKDSLVLIISSFKRLIGEVQSAANQVNAASNQVSSASQMLAQSSTEESQNMEMLGRSVTEISDRTQQTAHLVADASKMGDEMQGTATETNNKMNEMIQAVMEIKQASESIDNVIKVIEDIAFQTNILSLNASVEAARAGVHGKGFAVVAEEVGDLASKSAEAAKTTAELILDTIEKSDKGFRISQETSESITHIVDGIEKTASTLSTISEGTETQTKEIESINSAISEQIKVVHQNSATSEETAATSEEMSAQASQLLMLVSRFKLENNATDNMSYKPREKSIEDMDEEYWAEGQFDKF